MKLTPEELASLSPDEAAALQGAEAETALNTMGDGAVDDDTDTGADDMDSGTASTEDAATDTSAAPASESATTEQAAAALEELAPADTAAAPELPTYEVPATDFKAQREALRAEKRELAKKWSDGDLGDDEYHAQVDEVDDKLATLLTEATRADTLREVNEQHAKRQAAAAEAAELDAMKAVAKASKEAKQIDYGTDTAAVQQFDMLFGALKADPANAKLPVAQVVQKAHAAVLALRGIVAAAPAPAPTPAPAPAARRNAPPSIGGLPNAAPAVVQDDLLSQFQRLSGTDAEEFLARLPANQVERLMRTTDNLGLH